MNLHRMNRLLLILKTALVVSDSELNLIHHANRILCFSGVFLVLQHIHSINSLSFIVTTILSRTKN